MIALIDYGAGNLYSLCNSLGAIGAPFTVTRDRGEIQRAQSVILPGVGAFGDAMKKLAQCGLIDVLKIEAEKKPLLGICLGMQILFARGYEFGEHEGLGLIPGEVKKIEEPGLIVPHMGWNSVKTVNPCALTEGIQEGEHFYFVHSYKACTDARYISLAAEYGGTVPALVHSGRVYGAQFHPEKSAKAGLRLLESFCAL